MKNDHKNPWLFKNILESLQVLINVPGIYKNHIGNPRIENIVRNEEERKISFKFPKHKNVPEVSKYVLRNPWLFKKIFLKI